MAGPVLVSETEATSDAADRGAWGSRTGFIMASVGSAVGLGNLWRFSYLTSENGGAGFVLLYIGALVLIGVPALLAELSLGRRTGANAWDAFASQGGKQWAWVGGLAITSSVVLLSYYSVIAGWTMAYLLDAARAAFAGGAASGAFADPGATFTRVSEGPNALIFHGAFMALTAAIVAGGVAKGIERASLVLMPVLLVAVVVLAAWAVTLPSAGAGLRFYLAPDLSRITSQTVVAAVGQAFFSVGIGMGTMLTYASYLGKDDSLSEDGLVIGFSDFMVAFVSGFMVFPLIFAFGLQGTVGESSIGALFIALPAAFNGLGGALGSGVSILFFTVLFFAALTSALSLLEVSVSFVVDRWGQPRRKVAILMAEVVFGLGIASALSTEFLGLADAILSNVMILGGGLALALFVGHWMPDVAEEMDRGGRLRLARVAVPLVRYVVPLALAIVLFLGVQQLAAQYWP